MNIDQSLNGLNPSQSSNAPKLTSGALAPSSANDASSVLPALLSTPTDTNSSIAANIAAALSTSPAPELPKNATTLATAVPLISHNNSVEKKKPTKSPQRRGGRKKINIEKIVDPKSRQVTFNKRKVGLMKKAIELSILCECDVTVMILRGDKLFQYSSIPVSDFLHNYDKFEGTYEILDNSDLPNLKPGKSSTIRVAKKMKGFGSQSSINLNSGNPNIQHPNKHHAQQPRGLKMEQFQPQFHYPPQNYGIYHPLGRTNIPSNAAPPQMKRSNSFAIVRSMSYSPHYPQRHPAPPQQNAATVPGYYVSQPPFAHPHGGSASSQAAAANPNFPSFDSRSLYAHSIPLQMVKSTSATGAPGTASNANMASSTGTGNGTGNGSTSGGVSNKIGGNSGSTSAQLQTLPLHTHSLQQSQLNKPSSFLGVGLVHQGFPGSSVGFVGNMVRSSSNSALASGHLAIMPQLMQGQQQSQQRQQQQQQQQQQQHQQQQQQQQQLQQQQHSQHQKQGRNNSSGNRHGDDITIGYLMADIASGQIPMNSSGNAIGSQSNASSNASNENNKLNNVGIGSQNIVHIQDRQGGDSSGNVNSSMNSMFQGDSNSSGGNVGNSLAGKKRTKDGESEHMIKRHHPNK